MTRPSTHPPVMSILLRRTVLCLSQEAVAAEAGISQAAYSDVERGVKPIADLPYRKVLNLARALRWSLTELQSATKVYLGMDTPELAPATFRLERPELQDLHTTDESKAKGKMLEQARHRAKLDLYQAEKVSGAKAEIIRALEKGYDVLERLTIGEVRSLPLAFGLNAAQFSEIMDLQIITPSNLPKNLQAVARVLRDAED